MSKAQRKMNSKIGPLYLVASEKGLKGVFREDPKIAAAKDASGPEAVTLEKAERQIAEYLDGERKDFDLPLDPDGTEFQKRVWERLSRIPYGATKSYKEIAMELHDGNASRAVGAANGKNPLCIVVPCHRVISSDGSPGGYSGGPDLKKRLLALEKNGRLP